MQLSGNFDVLSFFRITQLNWFGHVNRMVSARKVSQVFHSNTQRSQLRGQPNTRWWNCVKTDMN